MIYLSSSIDGQTSDEDSQQMGAACVSYARDSLGHVGQDRLMQLVNGRQVVKPQWGYTGI